MEDAIINAITQITLKSPFVLALYLGLSGAYSIFCAVASITANKGDDKLADRLRRFFSLTIKK